MKTPRLPLMVTAALVATLALPSQASALGCNGIVNPMLTGCTRSDDNNGAKFPYHRSARVAVPAAGVKIEMIQGTPMIQYQGQWMPVVSAGGGKIVAASTSGAAQ
ncbi:MAG: hypothetical protein JOZ90_16885 [Alphaproteobacteria bacterium]|nr:hypothetical protein [Alphaproteobacteria bacterium]MBV9371511.1 hypothetical protein [Alphaproteobacteria bacterium]MBV9902747.1 hypothetical protein [Alphaproteobacteria bacterium]